MNPLEVVEDAAGVAAGGPVRLWLIGGLVVATLAAGGYWLHRYGEARYEAGQDQVQGRWNAEKVQQQAAAVATAAANASETQRRLAAQQEAQHAHDSEIAAAQRDVAAARTAADGLRRQLVLYTAAARGGAAAGNTAAGQLSAPTGDPIGLLANLFGRADKAAGDLATDLDAARAAGNQCERAYDALTQAEP